MNLSIRDDHHARALSDLDMALFPPPAFFELLDDRELFDLLLLLLDLPLFALVLRDCPLLSDASIMLEIAA